MPLTPEELEDQKTLILDRVSVYLEEGTTEEAIERLEDLMDELRITRDSLKDDIKRMAADTTAEDE